MIAFAALKWRWVACLLVAAGCGGGGGTGNADASAAIDGAPPVAIGDAAVFVGFMEPIEVPTVGLVDVYAPTLSAGANVIVVSSTTTGAGDLYSITREDSAASYGAPALIAGVNSASSEREPWISPDASTIVFSSDRAPSQGFDVWISSMPEMGMMATPSRLTESSDGDDAWVQWGSIDASPRFLFFIDPDGEGASYYVMAEGDNLNTWDPGFPVGFPTLTRDARTLVFELNDDLFMAVGSSDDSFSTPFPLSDVNSEAVDTSPALSPDGDYLAFVSNRSGAYKLYLAQRRTAGP